MTVSMTTRSKNITINFQTQVQYSMTIRYRLKNVTTTNENSVEMNLGSLQANFKVSRHSQITTCRHAACKIPPSSRSS